MLKDDVDDDNVYEGIINLEESDQFTDWGFVNKEISSKAFYESMISNFILAQDIKVKKWPFAALVGFQMDTANLKIDAEEPFSMQLINVASSVDDNHKGAGNPTRKSTHDAMLTEYDHELVNALMEKTNLGFCFE